MKRARLHACDFFCIVDALTSASMLPGINGYFVELLGRCRLRRSRPRAQYVKIARLRHWNARLAHKTILF